MILRPKFLVSMVGAAGLLLLFSFSASASAAATIEPGASYVISGKQLMTLNDDLNRLKAINAQQQQRLEKQTVQLNQLQMQLEEARASLQTSREELQKAKENSTKASDSLTNANQSLTAWSAEQKRTRLRIKRQRNAWEAIAAGALIAWASK